MHDAYGTRFLLIAPFGYDEEVDHWYAWDVDTCWILNVVGAGVFDSAQDALAEWQHAVGPVAGTALSPCAPEMTVGLLAACLQTGPMSDMLEGSEPCSRLYTSISAGSTTTAAAGWFLMLAMASSSGTGVMRGDDRSNQPANPEGETAMR